MWIRIMGHLFNSNRFLAFFAREDKLFALDKNSKLHLVAEYENEKDLREAMNYLGEKLRSK